MRAPLEAAADRVHVLGDGDHGVREAELERPQLVAFMDKMTAAVNQLETIVVTETHFRFRLRLVRDVEVIEADVEAEGRVHHHLRLKHAVGAD